MALARCDEHKPDNSGDDYHTYALPVGYPQTAVTCDVADCHNPARLWLTKDERQRFLAGERVFSVAGGTRLRVADNLFPN